MQFECLELRLNYSFEDLSELTSSCSYVRFVSSDLKYESSHRLYHTGLAVRDRTDTVVKMVAGGYKVDINPLWPFLHPGVLRLLHGGQKTTNYPFSSLR